MLGTMLIAIVSMMVAAFVVIWGLMWAAARWVHNYVALAIGVIASLFFVQNIVRGMIYCAQEPTYISPTDGEDGAGRMIHNCDSAGGIIDYFYLYVAGPMLVIGLVWLVRRFWPKRDLVTAGQ